MLLICELLISETFMEGTYFLSKMHDDIRICMHILIVFCGKNKHPENLDSEFSSEEIYVVIILM